ncbi:hypothetical protein PFISCL1PPCAC_480, partial [Pristionchus fissidentatus]
RGSFSIDPPPTTVHLLLLQLPYTMQLSTSRKVALALIGVLVLLYIIAIVISLTIMSSLSDYGVDQDYALFVMEVIGALVVVGIGIGGVLSKNTCLLVTFLVFLIIDALFHFILAYATYKYAESIERRASRVRMSVTVKDVVTSFKTRIYLVMVLHVLISICQGVTAFFAAKVRTEAKQEMYAGPYGAQPGPYGAQPGFVPSSAAPESNPQYTPQY